MLKEKDLLRKERKKKPHDLLSKSETDATKKMFHELATEAPYILRDLERLTPPSDNDDLCQALVNVSSLTASTLPLIRFFILDEFKKNCKGEPGSIMRGNCIASKVTKFYLHKIGRTYLKELIVPFINSLDADKSMEIDPNKLENISDIDGNKAYLMDKTKQILASIMSTEKLESMPIEIKLISNYFAEFAALYASDQFFSLIGGFLFLRYFNPGLSTPQAFGILPESKPLPPILARNLILITKVLQNLSNGVEFTNKELYMVPLNDFIRANFWRMEKYFKSVFTTSTAHYTPVVDPQGATDQDIKFLYNLFLSKKDKILELLGDNPSVLNSIKNYLQELGQYKHILNYLEADSLSEAPGLVRITIEAGEQSFEYATNGSLLELQSLAQTLYDKIQKWEEKHKKDKKSEAYDTTVFGKPLEIVVEHQKIKKPNLKIPEFIQDAVNHLFLTGLAEEGIFRVSGDKASMDQIKAEIDKGNGELDIATTTSLIKQYIRELPIALIPPEVFESFVNASEASAKETVKPLIEGLPAAHYDLLEELVNLFWQITKSSSRNLMHSSNLSSVLGPTIVRPPSNAGSVESLTAANKLMQLLIQEYEYIFQRSIEAAENSARSSLWKLKLYGPAKSIQELAVVDSVVCASCAYVIRVWDAETYNVVMDIDNGSHIISMCVVGNELWTASDKVIQVWNPKTGESLAKLGTPCCSLLRVDKYQLWAAALSTPQVIVYDISTRSILHTITNTHVVYHLQLVNDTVWGATGAGLFYMWDTIDYQTFEIPSPQKKKFNSILSIGEVVWAAGDDGAITVINKSTYETVKRIDTRSGKIKYLGYFDHKIWCCTWDMTIKVYTEEFEIVDNLKNKHSDGISSIAFVYNKQKQKWYAWTSSFDRSVCVWMLDNVPENPLTHDDLQKHATKTASDNGSWSRSRPTKPGRLSVTNDIRRSFSKRTLKLALAAEDELADKTVTSEFDNTAYDTPHLEMN